MKYLKSYEHTIEDKHTKPQIGDYVIMKTLSTILEDFINNNIGQITNITTDNDNKRTIFVTYENVPPKIIKYLYQTDITSRRFDEELILHFSPNKEDLETILRAKKYNL